MAYGDKEEQQPVRPLRPPKPELKLPTKKEQWNDCEYLQRLEFIWLNVTVDHKQNILPHPGLV